MRFENLVVVRRFVVGHVRPLDVQARLHTARRPLRSRLHLRVAQAADRTVDAEEVAVDVEGEAEVLDRAGVVALLRPPRPFAAVAARQLLVLAVRPRHANGVHGFLQLRLGRRERSPGLQEPPDEAQAHVGGLAALALPHNHVGLEAAHLLVQLLVAQRCHCPARFLAGRARVGHIHGFGETPEKGAGRNGRNRLFSR